METHRRNPYICTALALYFTYFVHGIGVSILSQYKTELAGAWGSGDVAAVLGVIAALGLGRLIALPVAGPVSDRFGRKTSGLIGVVLYALFFLGAALSPSARVAYIWALAGGIANSFLDTCVTPSILEIFGSRGPRANMFTKFAMSIGQFALPFMIGFAARTQLSFRALFYGMAALIAIDGVLLLFLPFPPKEGGKGKDETGAMGIKKGAPALVAMGFTATATFILWLNCNQELGALYGVADPSKIQSVYALGTILAILATAGFVLKKLREEDVLVLYPALCMAALALVYFVRTPLSVLVAAFLIGYGGAGGVLQLVVATANELYPRHKGKITSTVMIASSVANYVVLDAAARISRAAGAEGPVYVVLFNMAITAAGIALALYFRKQRA